jgi:hypothetical protein
LPVDRRDGRRKFLAFRLTTPLRAKPDAQQMHEVLLKMFDRWNAHDLEGHLDVYWKSAELLVVIDSEQLTVGSNFMIPT